MTVHIILPSLAKYSERNTNVCYLSHLYITIEEDKSHWIAELRALLIKLGITYLRKILEYTVLTVINILLTGVHTCIHMYPQSAKCTYIETYFCNTDISFSSEPSLPLRSDLSIILIATE